MKRGLRKNLKLIQDDVPLKQRINIFKVIFKLELIDICTQHRTLIFILGILAFILLITSLWFLYLSSWLSNIIMG